jgi:hypothetical protein
MAGAPQHLARMCNAPIVNAGDGSHEHPTQALLDALTIREYKGRIEGLKVAIIGDILHSRVARSNIYLLTKLGANVSVGGPGTLVPDEFASWSKAVCASRNTFEDAIDGADVVMILRIQRERQDAAFFPSMREYAVHYGLQPRHLERAAPDVIVMHPGPMNRGVEISSEIADGSQSLILDQVTTESPCAWRCFTCSRRQFEKKAPEENERKDRNEAADCKWLRDRSAHSERGRSCLIEKAVVGLLDRRTRRKTRTCSTHGLIVAPGFIDLHTHCANGSGVKETIATAPRRSRWLDQHLCDAETRSHQRQSRRHRFIIEQGQAANFANVFPIGAVTKGSGGKELAEMGEMKNAGIVAVSDDGRIGA